MDRNAEYVDSHWYLPVEDFHELRAAGLRLAAWTQHHSTCARVRSTADDCTCGLHEAWAPFDEGTETPSSFAVRGNLGGLR